ncbi:CD82 antigen isoform X3 [Pungitius pungitius]|uniref:CD82 antigen isoform X3 n=1 Tax=Pungitius pungitius TaxID=134920 RepID=UPI002E1239B0
MKLDVKIQMLNFFFEVFNFIFLVLGFSVCGIGLWILFDGGNLLNVDASDELRVVGAGLMLIGLVVLAVSIVGIVGAMKEIRVLLLVYMGLLIALVLGQLFVTLLLLINRDKIEQSLDQTVNQIILWYDGHNRTDTLMDQIQRYESCCGRMGPSDWLQNSFLQIHNLTNQDLLPCSCFNSSRPAINSPWCSESQNLTGPVYGVGGGSYEQGCKQKLVDWLQENMLTLIAMDTALMLIQVVQFVFSVYLYRALGSRTTPKDPEPGEHQDLQDQNYADVDPDNEDLHYASLRFDSSGRRTIS